MLLITGILFVLGMGFALADLYLPGQKLNFWRDIMVALSNLVIWLTWKILI